MPAMPMIGSRKRTSESLGTSFMVSPDDQNGLPVVLQRKGLAPLHWQHGSYRTSLAPGEHSDCAQLHITPAGQKTLTIGHVDQGYLVVADSLEKPQSS